MDENPVTEGGEYMDYRRSRGVKGYNCIVMRAV